MSSDVVIIGAGVIGLTCAWQLAEAGATVRVLDPSPARGASWAAAGMLAPVTELHYGEDALLQLNLAAVDRWPAHAAALAAAGVDVGYVECGSLLVARDADDAAEHRRLLAVQEQLGMDVEWVRSRDLRRLEPALSPSVRSGIRVDGDHQVDNRALVEGLLALCRFDNRVTVDTDRVAAVQRDDARVTGVVTGDGRTLRADRVVLAAGARSGLVDGLDLPAPVRPVKGQLLHLRNTGGPLLRRNIRGEDCYIVSRPDGRVVVGATMEEQGFDDRPTAGAVRDLLQAAWELVPGLAEATFVEVAVGFRPGSPDNAPLMGPLPGHEGLVVATGHARNGVLQSALTAEAVVAWVTGTDVPDAVVPFAPDRIASPAA